jgi:hypothetical protein
MNPFLIGSGIAVALLGLFFLIRYLLARVGDQDKIISTQMIHSAALMKALKRLDKRKAENAKALKVINGGVSDDDASELLSKPITSGNSDNPSPDSP